MLRTLALLLTTLTLVACPTPDEGNPDDAGTTTALTDDAGPTTDTPLAPGAACDCDDDCEGTTDNPGLCVFGICMQAATGECAAAGSQDECATGSRCWGLSSGAPICWPDCDAYTCDGECDGDGSCIPNADSTCDETCSEHCGSSGEGSSDPNCPPNSHLEGEGDEAGCVCDEGYQLNSAGTACVLPCETHEECPIGEVCVDDHCALDVGEPPQGTPPACDDLPSWECEGDEAYCGELVVFDPRLGDGYWDYPLNGETEANQYRSYVRRDVMLLVKYATARTRCLLEGFEYGNGGELGLGDMSEVNGDIPGTSDGYPGHPEGTHVDGHDMDIAYYQVNTPDNRLREVCEHYANGEEQYHCTGSPHLLDVWRTAAFIAELHVSPQLRVIGVDGRIGPLVESAVDQMCASGWLSGAACDTGLQLAYETTNQGYGWYYFHHHHLHISLLGRGSGFSAVSPEALRGARTCFNQSCEVLPLRDDPRRHLVTPRPLKQR